MKMYVHTVLEAGEPRSGCLCARVWWRLFSWSAEGHLLAASLPLLIGTHPFLRTNYLPIFKYHHPSSWIAVSNYLHVSDLTNSQPTPQNVISFLKLFQSLHPVPTQPQGVPPVVTHNAKAFWHVYYYSNLCSWLFMWGWIVNHTRA